MTKGSAILGFFLCFIGGMVLMWGIDKYGAHAGAEVTKEGSAIAAGASVGEDASVPVTAKDPSWGNADAPVTVVLFSDYQCPFCTRVEPTIKALKEKYGPEKLRVVWKHYPLPFHKQAVPAHVASQTVFEIAGNDAFWKFHETVFANQKALNPDNFEAWAVQAGVDGAKFKAAFTANTAKAKVDKDLADGQKAGVRGTPASFVNGIFISGAQPQNAFEAEIDKQLAEAQKLIAAGTPKAQIYTTLTNKNHKAAAPEAGDDKKPERPDPTADKTVWKVPVLKTDPVKGGKNALVTIIEFSDYECPYCKKVEPTIKELMDTYKDKLRVVWKDNPLPFHKKAGPAAILGREAHAQKGNDGFWQAHAMLFENNQKLGDEDLIGYAEKLGLDVAKAKIALEKKTHQGLIDDCQMIADDFQAGGTPHFFVNGRRLAGALPVDMFKKVIDEEIKKAEELLAKGVKAENLYEEITKDGKAPPPPEKKDAGPAPKDAPYKGAKNAKVVIQEFSDFECPYCSRVNDTLKQVMEKYGDKVKIVWRHKPLPFHKNAPLAHQAAMEAFAQKGNEGFWAMHDKLFANQKSLGRADLDKYAQELGLDMDKFKKALDGEVHKARLEQDVAASDKIGIGGTPGFTVNGYFIEGAQGLPAFRKAIELALKEAK